MKKINRTLATAMVVATTLSLGACSMFERQNAYTRQDQLNGATTGAGVGATAGAVAAGIATGGTGAVVASAVGGGIVGGLVGYSMDRDEAAIRQKMAGYGVSVMEVGGSNAVLVLPPNVNFATGSAQLSPEFQNSLNGVAEVMKEYPYTVAEIPGHADYRGSQAYNMRLSLARAQAVADYLNSQGISGERLVPEGYGKLRPIANSNTPYGMAMNRRVQIYLYAPSLRNSNP